LQHPVRENDPLRAGCVVGYAFRVPQHHKGSTIKFVLVTLAVGLCGCAARATRPADGAPDPVVDGAPAADGVALLSHYPQSPALAQTRDTYAAAGRGRDSVFMSTWFPGRDARVGEWSSIDSRGRVTIYRFVHDVGFQDRRSTSLVESQLPELQSLLPTLPASSPPASLDRLLIVGFRRPTGEWDTRLYDRAAPPEAVRRIFNEMTGASLGIP
jgi:hypothetical protein